MQELRFDSIVYHFYYACRSEDGTRAMDAGFTWDPTRGRYYTADPQIAVVLSSLRERAS
jgi:hypothetical protein